MKRTIINTRVGVAMLTGAFALTLSSCGLFNKYQRPEVSQQTLDSVMRDADKYANTTDSASFGDLAWRDVFTDPQLQQLISQGLENNLDVFEATAKVQKLEEALKSAKLAFLPSLTFSPEGTLSNVFAGEMRNSTWKQSYTMPITASWNADVFGKILATKRGAEMDLAMVKDYQQAARAGVICGVANSYYRLLMFDRQLEILQKTEKLTKETWEMMKLQKELHGARETAVVSAEAAYLNVKASIVDMKQQIHATENALSLLIGQQAHAISRGKIEDQTMPENFSVGYPVRILAMRPDVHAAEMNLASCFHDIQVARSSFYPSLKITATGIFTNSLGSAVVNPGNMLANFVAGLTQPIFQNGRLRYQLKAAKIDYEVAEKEWEHSILSAGAEVSNALVEYNSNKEKGEIDSQRIEALKKSVEYTKNLFTMGSSTYLEVITAQSNLLQAETTKVKDDFNKLQAAVNLYNALGGGRY